MASILVAWHAKIKLWASPRTPIPTTTQPRGFLHLVFFVFFVFFFLRGHPPLPTTVQLHQWQLGWKHEGRRCQQPCLNLIRTSLACHHCRSCTNLLPTPFSRGRPTQPCFTVTCKAYIACPHLHLCASVHPPRMSPCISSFHFQDWAFVRLFPMLRTLTLASSIQHLLSSSSNPTLGQHLPSFAITNPQVMVCLSCCPRSGYTLLCIGHKGIPGREWVSAAYCARQDTNTDITPPTGVIRHQLLQAVELRAGGDVEATAVQLADLVVFHVEPLGVVKVRDREAVGTCGKSRCTSILLPQLRSDPCGEAPRAEGND